MVRLYITADHIGTQTGGGILTRNELEALRSLGDEVVVLDAFDISPTQYGLPDIPYVQDYIASMKVRELLASMKVRELLSKSIVRHAHIYSGVFSATVGVLVGREIPVTYTCPAHDRALTIEEFARQGVDYPYIHIKDDQLWEWSKQGLLQAYDVIAPSRHSADFLTREGCTNVHIIPHGCDIPEQVVPFPSEFRVGYLGQPGIDKGLIYLLKAWEKLNYPDALCCLAGRGTDTLGPYIGRQVDNGRFALKGFVQSPSELYNFVSVYVQPSVTESWGIEVGEAMAHGRPVIVSKGAGAADMVTDGIDGFIVPSRDPDAIADRIDWLRNPDTLRIMGERAREKAKTYSWTFIREQYVKLWSIH